MQVRHHDIVHIVIVTGVFIIGMVGLIREHVEITTAALGILGTVLVPEKRKDKQDEKNNAGNSAAL